MKSCINCDACWAMPTDGYGCLKGKRQTIKDLFVLNRIRCAEYNQVDLLLTTDDKSNKKK